MGDIIKLNLSGLLILSAFLPAGAAASETAEKLASSSRLENISVRTIADFPVQVPLAAPAPGTEVSVAGSAGQLRVTFVDVGQGDAEFIELPNGQTVLIDGGPANREGGPADSSHPANDPPLAHFLLRKGVKRIDHVVLTHPHADHYVGLKYVFSRLPVGNFYDTRKDNPGTGDDEVRAKAAALPGIRLFYPAPGEYLDWGPGVQAKVISSCPDAAASAPVSPNNCSLVIRLAYQGSSLLFTGDMEADKEAEVVAKYGAELKSDVLKVGHHGSRGASSEPFLRAVSPALAYIEVGVNNSYGHPRPEALARLQAVGARIYRTDLEGTLEYFPGALR